MNFRHAIVRGVPKSLAAEAQRIDENHDEISFDLICQQKQVLLTKTIKFYKFDLELLHSPRRPRYQTDQVGGRRILTRLCLY